MKISTDVLMGLFFTVAAGIVLWLVKLAIQAIKDAVLKQVNQTLDIHKGQIEQNKNTIETIKEYAEENRERINFLINSLINKNK